MKKALAVALILAGGLWLWRRDTPAPAKEVAFNRFWIDHLPRNETDMAQVFVAITEQPLGAFESRSRWKGEFEGFRWEPRGEGELVLLFPQSRSRETVKYRATECNEGGFQYCLEIAGASRGAKTYYSKRGWDIRSLEEARSFTQ